jgi:epoxyqueuosine reductase
VLIAVGNSGDATLAGAAERLLDDASPLVRGAAVWALGRLDRARLGRCAARHRAGEPDPEVIAEWNASISHSGSREAVTLNP